MKILVIDYLSPKGHDGWFKLQINSLQSLGHEVRCIYKEGYGESVGLSKNNIQFLIPSDLYTTNRGLKYRWDCMKILLYIKKRVDESEWDAIILSSYEIISLSVLPIFKKALIVNHNNVPDALGSKLKMALFKRLPKQYVHIAFNDIIKNKVEELVKNPVAVVPLGLLDISYTENSHVLTSNSLKAHKYLLCPTRSISDFNIDIMETICNSKELNEFISQNEMKMLLRQKVAIQDQFKNNYVNLDGFISNDEYYTLLSNCYAMIFCLNPKSFSYRISNTLFESMKLGFPIFIYKNDTLGYYEKYHEGRLIFETPSELVNLLKSMKEVIWKPSIHEIANPKKGWEQALEIYMR